MKKCVSWLKANFMVVFWVVALSAFFGLRSNLLAGSQSLEDDRRDDGTGQWAATVRTAERSAVGSSVPQPAAARLPPPAQAIRESPQRVPAPPLVPQPTFAAHKAQTTVELTGVVGILARKKAFLEITEPGLGRAPKKVTVEEGDLVDSIEVLQIDVEKGQVKIRNSGVEGMVSFRTPQIGAANANPQIAGQQSSFATPPGNWPLFFGDLNGGLELRIKNPNEFSVRVGLRSGGKGKDFIVPAYGTQSVQVPAGYYVTYFQYSSEPGGMYQGDSFTMRNNATTQITITKVVNGNYGIRKVN